MFAIVEEEMSGRDGVGGERLDDAIAEHWMAKRNDVAALERLITDGLVVDTMEVSGPWSALPRAVRRGARGDRRRGRHAGGLRPLQPQLPRRRLPVLHLRRQATRARRRGPPHPGGDRPLLPRASGTPAPERCSPSGGSLSHHHGVGINRGRYMAEALGAGADVLATLKAGLDPKGILNPGKLGIGVALRRRRPALSRPQRPKATTMSRPSRHGTARPDAGPGAVARHGHRPGRGAARRGHQQHRDRRRRGPDRPHWCCCCSRSSCSAALRAGGRSIRLSSTARLTHAAGAAAAAYVIAQGLGVVLRLARGDELSWVGYPFLALLMATCGMLGGMFARRWQQQNGPGASRDGGG